MEESHLDWFHVGRHPRPNLGQSRAATRDLCLNQAMVTLNSHVLQMFHLFIIPSLVSNLDSINR